MLSDKRLKKVEKELGKEILAEIEAASVDSLKNRIVNAESAISDAIKELEANDKYQELKESLKAMSAGLRDLKKYQKAVIELSLSVLEDKGHE